VTPVPTVHLPSGFTSFTGEIYQEPGYQPLRADSDVHLVPRIAGG
jgi:hypothetical protein